MQNGAQELGLFLGQPIEIQEIIWFALYADKCCETTFSPVYGFIGKIVNVPSGAPPISIRLKEDEEDLAVDASFLANGND